MLHKRVGDDVLRFLLVDCALFVCSGRNYVQISGLPIYNMLGRNYTPLGPPPKRRNKRKLSRSLASNTQNAASRLEAAPPCPKLPKLDSINSLEYCATSPVHAAERHTTEEPRNANGIAQDVSPRNTHMGLPVSAATELQSRQPTEKVMPVPKRCVRMKRKGKRQRRARERGGRGRVRHRGLLWRLRRQSQQRKRKRQHYLERKRELKGGSSLKCLGDRQMQRCIRQQLQTIFRKMDSMYSANPHEGYPQSCQLNVIHPSRRIAQKLVRAILTAQPATTKPYKGTKIQRLPKRLLHTVGLFHQILQNYHKLKLNRKFVAILNTVCSLPQTGLKEVQVNTEKETYRKLLLSCCSTEQVSKFLVVILSRLIPPEMWGSVENQTRFLSNLPKFLALTRWEKLSTRQLMQGLRPSHCHWLQTGSGRSRPSTSRSDSLKQTELLSRFVSWLMGLVVDTVKGFFYVTEHCDHRNRVFYYRKPVWNQLCKMALEERLQTMFCHLDKAEVEVMLLRGKALGVSNLRFLPKAASLRPIVNLGSRVSLDPAPSANGRGFQTEPKSVNNQLFDLFKVLKFEKSRQTHGSSCSGYHEIHRKLRAFSDKLGNTAQLGKTRPPLYSVHVDIANCFDSVEPRLLYSILKNRILAQQSYLLRRYTTIMLSNRTIKRSFVKAATTRELCQAFVKFASDLSHNTSLRNAILTDMVAYPVIDRVQLLSQLKSHLFNNVVRFRGQFFRQTKGIPQGSCISSLLCSFYYDEMEREHLPDINPDTGLLMHYVDDFLLLTQDLSTARKFLEIMTNGIPEYNCYVNPTKTSTNFSVHDNGTVHLDSEKQWMKWCGLLINTRNLEVRYDYSRYTRKRIRDNLTIVSHTRPFHNLLRLVKRAVRLRCLPIFLDCKLLSEKTVLINIYQLFLLVAVKLHAAVRALQLPRGRRYTRFFLSCIQQSTRFFYSLARNKCKNAEEQTSFTLPLELCTWLGCHAYQRVLQKKDPGGHTYGLLVKVLSSRINTVADTMGLDQVKRCLRATSLADCQAIFRVKC